MDEALPPQLALEWERLRWCATMGWTFAEFDGMDVQALARAGLMVSKAARYNVGVRLA